MNPSLPLTMMLQSLPLILIMQYLPLHVHVIAVCHAAIFMAFIVFQ